jgi:hypothetical protein
MITHLARPRQSLVVLAGITLPLAVHAATISGTVTGSGGGKDRGIIVSFAPAGTGR